MVAPCASAPRKAVVSATRLPSRTRHPVHADSGRRPGCATHQVVQARCSRPDSVWVSADQRSSTPTIRSDHRVHRGCRSVWVTSPRASRPWTRRRCRRRFTGSPALHKFRRHQARGRSWAWGSSPWRWHRRRSAPSGSSAHSPGGSRHRSGRRPRGHRPSADRELARDVLARGKSGPSVSTAAPSTAHRDGSRGHDLHDEGNDDRASRRGLPYSAGLTSRASR